MHIFTKEYVILQTSGQILIPCLCMEKLVGFPIMKEGKIEKNYHIFIGGSNNIGLECT